MSGLEEESARWLTRSGENWVGKWLVGCFEQFKGVGSVLGLVFRYRQPFRLG